MNAVNLISTAQAEKGFYPTPIELGRKLLSGIKWDTVQNVLEPSAGKGDLVRAVADRLCVHLSRYSRESIDVDCVEIDPQLRGVLQYEFSEGHEREIYDLLEYYKRKSSRHSEQAGANPLGEDDKVEEKYLEQEKRIRERVNVRIVHDDFLTFESRKKYDLIVMNPPFADGDLHLLKAIQYQERLGGRIRCILNADTLQNPYTKRRQTLLTKLEELGAKVSYEDGAFRDAERATEVSIAIIKIRIPEPHSESDIYERLRKAANLEDTLVDDVTDLTVADFFTRIVSHFNVEVDCGLELIRQYNALRPYLLNTFDEKAKKYAFSTLTLTVGSSERYSGNGKPNVNRFIRCVRIKYWNALFSNKELMGRLTSNLQEKYRGMVDSMADYDFTLFNIQQIVAEMNSELNQGIQDTILALFEDFTTKYSYYPGTANNIHYYNGWCTNKAHKINYKVVIPAYNLFSYSREQEVFDVHAAASKLSDIEKAFDYLDGNMTASVNLYSVLQGASYRGQTRNIQCKYFDVTLYKKGTMHIRFHNHDLVDRFNIYCCKQRGWLPPRYGKTTYAQMDKKEQEVVDGFHGDGSAGSGQEDYGNVMARASYFLAEPVQHLPLLSAARTTG